MVLVQPFKKRLIAPSDAFFDAGNLAREMCFKKLSVASGEVQFMEAEDPIVCGIGGCKAVLKSAEMYEVHYATLHVNVCSVCQRVFPTCRLLSLHVQEAHDSFFAEMAKRENMYECLVEGCGRKFKGDFQRRWHLINVHQYPKTFRFHFESVAQKQEGKKGKAKKGRGKQRDQSSNREHEDAASRRDESRNEEDMIETEEAGQGDADMQDICEGMRKLAFPSHIKFGHNSERGLMRPPKAKKEGDGKKKKNRKPFGKNASNGEGGAMVDVGERPLAKSKSRSNAMDAETSGANDDGGEGDTTLGTGDAGRADGIGAFQSSGHADSCRTPPVTAMQR